MSKKKALSFSQFIKRFPNEEACVKYLYAVKWPSGRARGNQAVFVAVSKDEKGNPAYLRMQLTPNVQSKSIENFARSRIAYGSTVQTDGFNTYRKPLAERFDHEWAVFNPDGELLK